MSASSQRLVIMAPCVKTHMAASSVIVRQATRAVTARR